MSIQRYDHDSHSDCYGMVRSEEGDFVKYEDHVALTTKAVLPNPSADEEVETPRTNEELVDAKHCDECGYEVVLADAMRKLERELTQLRQQHNAEREEFIESAVARDKKADEDRDAYESLINELKAQLEAARTQCALRSAGHDDLRTRLNKANAQKTALYFENSDALAELQQLRTSLAEKEMALNEQMVMRSQDVKTRDELIESMADTANQWQDRYAKLQSELATAQAEKHGLEDVVLATRNMSIEAFDRIRALIGASPNDPRPCETLVSELIESLRSQLQTAMEERDAAIRNRDEWRNAATESKQAYGAANSRLEEAEKAALSIYRRVNDWNSGGFLHVAGNIRDELWKDFASLLSRLSTSRETENKTDEKTETKQKG